MNEEEEKNNVIKIINEQDRIFQEIYYLYLQFLYPSKPSFSGEITEQEKNDITRDYLCIKNDPKLKEIRKTSIKNFFEKENQRIIKKNK